MRLALVVPGGVDASGRERVIPVLLSLIERLARRHDVIVLALGQNEAPGQWTLSGATVIDLGRARRPLIPGTGVLARIRQLRRAAQTGVSVPPKNFDVVHAFWASPCGFLAVNAFRGTPAVVSLAGGELAAIPSIGYGCGLHWRERWKVAHALRRAAVVTAASSPMIVAAKEKGVDAHLVPLGIAPVGTRGSASATLVTDENEFRLLHVASLNRVKDQPTLLRAFAAAKERVPGLVLDIVGEDTLGGSIQSLAGRLGISDMVRFHGWLPVDEVRTYFERADLFVMSSLHEAGPVAYVEASAHRIATVGTAVGHIVEGSPERAFAVPVGDAGALADAIVTLVNDPQRRRAIADAAYAWASANDADATAARFEAIYDDLMDCGRPARQPVGRPGRR